MPKPTKKSQKARADKLFSLVIRKIGKCEKCGSTTGQLQCAHIYSRRHLHTRYDLNNALCLCAGCHFWAHQNPVLFARWLEIYVGGSLLDQLRDKTNEFGKIDYEQIVKDLQAVYELSS
jgi:hypothetical protein